MTTTTMADTRLMTSLPEVFGGGVLQVAEVGLAAAAEEVGAGLFALTGILAPT